EDPDAGAPRQRGKTVNIFAAVQLERLRIINAVEIAVRLQLAAHAVDLPAFHLGLEILREHLQPADQLLARVDIRDLEHAIAHADARHQLLGGGGADKIRALPRQRPKLPAVLETDALDQFADRKVEARPHRAELMAGRIPADMPALEHGD